MKKNLTILVIIAIVGIVLYSIISTPSDNSNLNQNENNSTSTLENEENNSANGTQTEEEDKTESVIGTSVEGRDIVAYHYGTGENEILFIGGVHGGYAWNSVLLAYQFIDYFQNNVIPDGLKVTVIPVLNADGLNKVVGTTTVFLPTDVSPLSGTVAAGRFNANIVDLNRNFDCNWKDTGVWQTKPVSGGSAAFSEPESMALKSYIEAHNPIAVIVFDSAAGGVFSSDCGNGILPETAKLNQLYVQASGYKTYDTFDFYEMSGDMTNWLAKKNIPAISVLMTTHGDTEWTKNLAGVKAIFEYYSK